MRVRQANKIVARCLQKDASAYAVKMRSKVDTAVSLRHKRKTRRKYRPVGVHFQASVPVAFAAKIYDAYREFHQAVLKDVANRLNMPRGLLVSTDANANYSAAKLNDCES
jgi:transcription elongation factor